MCLRRLPRGGKGERGCVYDSRVGEERERDGGRDGELMGLGKADVDVEVGRGRVGGWVHE